MNVEKTLQTIENSGDWVPCYLCQQPFDEDCADSWNGLCPACANANYILTEGAPGYPVGFVGRTDCEIIAVTDDCEEVEMPAGSLARVTAPGEQLADPLPNDDCIRYTIEFLTETGDPDPRGCGYSGAWHGLLGPVPAPVSAGSAVWTEETSQKAAEQGWNISDTGRPERPFELQRIDEAERFARDVEAWGFVWNAAKNNDPLAKQALEFLREKSPVEYADISSYCLTLEV